MLRSIVNYELGEASASVKAAKKIADTLDINLDYLAGEESAKKLNGKNLERLTELEQIESSKRQVFYDLIDTYIRDAKSRVAYAQ